MPYFYGCISSPDDGLIHRESPVRNATGCCRRIEKKIRIGSDDSDYQATVQEICSTCFPEFNIVKQNYK